MTRSDSFQLENGTHLIEDLDPTKEYRVAFHTFDGGSVFVTDGSGEIDLGADYAGDGTEPYAFIAALGKSCQIVVAGHGSPITAEITPLIQPV